MNETTFLDHVRMHASEQGTTLFRNQVGLYELADGRTLRSGLCVGSSDLIGWTTVEITPEMVGQRIAVFTAIEAKSPQLKAPKPTTDQQRFINAVELNGGIAFVTNNLEHCLNTLKRKFKL